MFTYANKTKRFCERKYPSSSALNPRRRAAAIIAKYIHFSWVSIAFAVSPSSHGNTWNASMRILYFHRFYWQQQIQKKSVCVCDVRRPIVCMYVHIKLLAVDDNNNNNNSKTSNTKIAEPCYDFIFPFAKINAYVWCLKMLEIKKNNCVWESLRVKVSNNIQYIYFNNGLSLPRHINLWATRAIIFLVKYICPHFLCVSKLKQ